MSQRIYEAVTNRIVTALEKGVVPWRRPWYESGPPVNVESKRPYRGVNLFLLSLAPYLDNRWLTFRQAKSLGGSVRKGEHASVVTFWKRWEVPSDGADRPRNPDVARRSIPLLRTYLVFNVEQCEGLRLPPRAVAENGPPESRIAAAETLVHRMPDPPLIVEQGERAYYDPVRDRVVIPELRRFCKADDFHATLFHELGHSTGHVSRLNRFSDLDELQFGSASYSREELVAELCSAFCCAMCGIDNSVIDNSASYIGGWLRVLKADSRALVLASAKAQRAADYIGGLAHSEDHHDV